MRYKIEAMLAGKYKVSLEEPFTDGRNVLSACIDILLSKTEIDHLYLMKILLMSCKGRWQANKDIIEFNIIESVA